jgi:hypothetical protein
MIKRILNWLLSFFTPEKEAKEVIKRIIELDEKLEEIEDEELSTDDIVEHFND